MYLLTFSGMLLSWDPTTESLLQMDFEQALASGWAIRLGFHVDGLDAAYKNFVEQADFQWSRELSSGPLAGYTITSVNGGRTVSLGKEGGYLCATPAHAGGDIQHRASAAGAWESFVCLSSEDIDIIREIIQNDWVIGSAHTVVSRKFIKLSLEFSLSLGEIKFDLRHNIPFQNANFPRRMTLLRDGWRIEEIFLFKPVVIFTAFKAPEVLRQLYVAIDSLLRFGGFTGQIQVITDQTKETILQNIPHLPEDRLVVQECQAVDWIGYVAAKYLMASDPDLFKFQPVLFSDPDMVFDSNMTQMLAIVASSPRIAAPVEFQSPLSSSRSVGSELLQEDGCEPYYEAGFNAGTLAIPNLVDHLETIMLIRRIIVNRAKIKGRGFHKWADQEIANYVSFKFGHFDKRLITPFVRYGFHGVETEQDKAVGIVHFWPPRGSAVKRQTMETYVGALDGQISQKSSPDPTE